jgi:hypothetical protein
MRTALAFVFAPCAAPLIYATLAATRRPPGEGPTWLDSFAPNFFLAGLMSVLISLTFGTLVFLVLKKTKRESVGAYALLGALGGFLYIAIAGIDQDFTPARFAACAIFTLLGLSVSTCFALIRGVPRQPIPNRTTE